jgi:hypothetical protein
MESHKKSKTTKTHILKYKEGNIDKVNIKRCSDPNHNELLSFYCFTCNILLCAKCITIPIDSSNSHKTHQFENIDDALRKMRTDIQVVKFDELETIRKEAANNCIKTIRKIALIDASGKEAIGNLTEYTEKCIFILKNQREKVSTSVNEQLEKEKSKFREYLQSVRLLEQEAQEQLAHIKHISSADDDIYELSKKYTKMIEVNAKLISASKSKKHKSIDLGETFICKISLGDNKIMSLIENIQYDIQVGNDTNVKIAKTEDLIQMLDKNSSLDQIIISLQQIFKVKPVSLELFTSATSKMYIWLLNIDIKKKEPEKSNEITKNEITKNEIKEGSKNESKEESDEESDDFNIQILNGLADTNIIGNMLSVANNYIQDEESSRLIIQCMGIMAKNDRLNKIISVNNGVDLIIDIISKHIETVKLHISALVSLRFMCKNKDNKRVIGAGKYKFKPIIEFMKKYKSSVDVQIHCLTLLWEAAFDLSDNQTLMGETNIMKMIIDLMKQYPDNVTLQTKAIGALSNPVLVFANKKNLADLKGVESVLQAMNKHVLNANLQTQGCAVLWNLASDEDVKDIIISKGGIAAVLLAMKRHLLNAELQIKACSALWNLAAKETTKDNFGIEGVKLLLQTIKMYNDNAEIIAGVFGVFRSLALQNKVCDIIHAQGGLEMAVNAIKKFKGNKQVTNNVCVTLQNTTIKRSELRAVISELGFIEILLDVIGESHDADVCINAYACMWNLTLNTDICNKIMSLDGVRKVITSIRENTHSLDLLTNAIAVLWNLSGVVSIRATILLEGGLDLVLMCMKKYFIEEANDLHIKVCAVIWNLTSNNDEIKSAFGKGPGTELILGSMRMFKNSAVLQAKACGALSNPASMSENKAPITRNGGIELITGAMEEHMHRVDVQTQACAVLWNLTFNNEENQKRMGKRELELILKAMFRFKDNAGLVTKACGALSNPALLQKNQIIILDYEYTHDNGHVDADFIKLITDVLLMHTSLMQLHIQTFSVLRTLASTNSIVRSKFGRTGIEIIVAAMKNWPEEEILQERACSLLHYIIINEDMIPIVEHLAKEFIIKSLTKFGEDKIKLYPKF